MLSSVYMCACMCMCVYVCARVRVRMRVYGCWLLNIVTEKKYLLIWLF